MDEVCGNYFKRNKPVTKKQILHKSTYELSNVDNIMGEESKMVIFFRVYGRELFNSRVLPDEKFWRLVANNLKFNTTKLYT